MDVSAVGAVDLDRFDTNPLITPTDAIGTNINGPSVVRVPDWVEDPLGRYYLYFAHHQGECIRLAYADDPRGPFTVHEPGTLHIAETRFDGHIASPDVHVDHDERRFRLYFHGCCGPFEHADESFSQVTDVAVSNDGFDFEVVGHTLGNSYFRVFEHRGTHFALANDGHLYRGSDPLAPFERLQELFPTNRHFAIESLDDALLGVYLTRRGDRPERIQRTIIDLGPDPTDWRADPHPPETVLWPVTDYEGGGEPVRASEGGAIHEPVRALRDPAVLVVNDARYLYYAIAGERGIAGAELRG